MILYFTGTGNSRYIAERISKKTDDNLLSINDMIKTNNIQPIKTNRQLVFVTPTYAWRIPKIVDEWIRRVEFAGAKDVWFVMDCGGEIGNAAKYNMKLCRDKGFNYMGTAQIVMPENYIAMFGVPSEEKAKQIVTKAEPIIDRAADLIAENRKFPTPRNNLYDKLMSGPVNAAFYPLCVKATAFSADEKCISCGKCVRLCPLNNIALKNGKPVWGSDCTHCMACISYCPTQAIEYGKKSVGKPRYYFENLK